MAKAPSLGERLDVIESAIGSALGINLSSFEPADAISGRNDRIAKAADQIAAMADEAARAAAAQKAAAEIVALSEVERIERLEAVIRSRGSL